MAIISLNSSNYQAIRDLNSAYATTSSSASKTSSDKELDPVQSGNNSELNAVVRQVLSQINSSKDISSFFSTEEGQQAGADFTSSLFSTLPGLSSDNANANKVTGIELDPSSSSYKLQNSIQKLITQLDNGKSDVSGLDKLQETFNALIKKSGGDPSSENLQSFLKLVAVNIQGSTSIGSLFSASA
ncbi:hypothetical protein [Undibacterium danionis]|uniref:DUF5610 domain-containing protein n=1 Tax=Undibacterium danionis TaxID=1812100 RepID=A0ABV6I9J3_9BURK